jgi:hypothetical protein
MKCALVVTLVLICCFFTASLLAQATNPPEVVQTPAQANEQPAPAQAPKAPAGAQPVPLQTAPHQPGEAELYGQVTDPSSAVVPGATVSLTNATGAAQNVTTNDRGQYFIIVAPSTYTLKISVKGFKDFTSEGLNLTAGQELEIDGSMEPAAATPEKVEVTGETVGHVETYNAEINETITAKQVEATPLNGRNFVSMLTFAPGVSNQSGQDEALVGVKGSVKFSVNGGRVEYNSFIVDGADVLHAGVHGSESTLVVYPSLDSINELKVMTSNYGAQFGRSASGTILVETKSGGTSFHGSAYYFGRNEIFNSRNYFDITNSAPKFRKNDFGFTLGGPLTIPHVYPHRDRTFFFFSEEFRLEKDPTDNNFNQAVPSVAERPTLRTNASGNQYVGADFSDVCPIIPPGFSVIVFNPVQYPDCPRSSALNTTFPFNIVGYQDVGFNAYPKISPVGASLAGSGMIPLPNSSVGCNSTIGSCYDFAFAQPTYWRQELFRIDHDLKPDGKLRATFRYIHDSWDTTEARPIWGYVHNSFPTVQGRLFGPGGSYLAHLTQTISNSLLNEIVVGYTASHISLTARPAAGVNIARPDDLTCVPGSGAGDCQGFIFNNCFGGQQQTDSSGNTTCTTGGKLSGIQLTPGNLAYGGGFKVDPGYAPWQLANPTWSFKDDISKVIGKHSVQAGLQVILGQRNEINATNGPNTGDLQGVLTFSNFNSATVGNEYANLLLGDVQSYQQDSAQLKYHNRYEIIEPYIQDDWKVNSRLQLNLGIRFSLFGNYHENNEQAWNWDPTKFVQPSKFLTFAQDGRMLYKGKPLPIDDLSNLSPFITNGLVECGTAASGVPSTCMRAHKFNPAPRIGFAFDPHGDGRTSIRAGYGIFFEHGTGSEANTGSLVGSAPLNLTMTQLRPYPIGVDGYPCIGGTAGGTFCNSGTGAYPIDVTSIPRKATWPYVQQWSLSVQREVIHNTVVSVAYVGSKGTHLTAVRQPNALNPAPQGENNGILLNGNPYGPHQPIIDNLPLLGIDDCNNTGTIRNPIFTVGGVEINKTQPAFLNLLAACENFNSAALLPINAYRPYRGIQKIFSLENVGDSNYHAFQATFRRTRGPITVDASYSYSHSIDDSSDRNDTTIVNPLVVSANKASSNFDQRHLINLSYVWTLPNVKFSSAHLRSWTNMEDAQEVDPSATPGFLDRAASGLLSGWSLAGVTQYQTGTPFTVINAGYGALGISVPDNAGVASGITSVASFPDIVGDIHGHAPVGANNSSSFGPALGNVAAFAAPRGLTFGDAGRNVLRNPGRTNFDMTLTKSFKVTEGTHMEFRSEVFNVFNHTQFRVYDPSPNFGNTSSNTIDCYGLTSFSAAGDQQTDCLTGNAFLHPVNAHRPRTMQFALKLTF